MPTNCPLCGSHLIHEARPRTITYRDHTASISQTADYCDSCGEAFLSPSDSKSTEKAVADFKRKVDHLLTSDEIKEIRRKYKITQKQAATLFGGGINAFSKYERGEAIQNRSTDLLLKLIADEIVNMETLLKVSQNQAS